MRVTADANIWISAFNFGGVAERILDLAEAGAIEIVISEEILEEVLDVLGRKFDWSAPELRMARNKMLRYAVIIQPTVRFTEIIEDPDDDRILGCAFASVSDVIVTGDKDLLRRGEFRGIKIIAPAQLAVML